VPQDSRLVALDDGALARRIAEAGATPDSAAETEFYRRLGPRVRLYGLRHLRDRQAAADLVQQVLLVTLERLRAGEVREPDRIASFVLGTCRMTVLDMRRGTRRREALLEIWGDAAEAFEAPEPLALDPDRLADVPFDAETGEVLVIPSAAWLKTMPAFTMRMRLIAVSEAGEKPIGDYTFNHSPP
jgi:DNA-directed RNA polymerase specialized sigma24 family protein